MSKLGDLAKVQHRLGDAKRKERKVTTVQSEKPVVRTEPATQLSPVSSFSQTGASTTPATTGFPQFLPATGNPGLMFGRRETGVESQLGSSGQPSAFAALQHPSDRRGFPLFAGSAGSKETGKSLPGTPVFPGLQMSRTN